MNKKAQAAVLGGFVADSMALGAHWIYDTNRIDREIGRVDRPMAPPAGSFHSTKNTGQFTHYGDQMLVLLASLDEAKGFDLNGFNRNWQALFDSYDGYVDHATKETLRRLRDGIPADQAGSTSSDLSGASRVAAMVYHCGSDVIGFSNAARTQAAMTHNHPLVLESAAFFAEVVSGVLQGQGPTDAIRTVWREGFDREPFSDWVGRGLQSAEGNTRQAIRSFGQGCDAEAAFPGVVHLVAKYEDRFPEGLVENTMAGGDSSARGILFGAIVCAHLGMSAIPDHWLSALEAKERIRSLIGA
jgi:ADP-ribosylglycohydrolase